MNEQQTSLLDRIKTRWPNEAKYRVSLESTQNDPELWYIRIENGFGPDGEVIAFGKTAQEAFFVLGVNAKDRPTDKEFLARKVAALEAELRVLQGEVTKPKEVA